MDSGSSGDSGNRAIAVILAAVVVVAALVWLFGYPLLIWVAVLSAFAALGFIVYISLGDMGAKPSRPSAEAPVRAAPAKV